MLCQVGQVGKQSISLSAHFQFKGIFHGMNLVDGLFVSLFQIFMDCSHEAHVTCWYLICLQYRWIDNRTTCHSVANLRTSRFSLVFISDTCIYSRTCVKTGNKHRYITKKEIQYAEHFVLPHSMKIIICEHLQIACIMMICDIWEIQVHRTCKQIMIIHKYRVIPCQINQCSPGHHLRSCLFLVHAYPNISQVHMQNFSS